MSIFLRKAAIAAAAGAVLIAGSPVAGAKTLNINGQAQEQDNWCWAATGNSIASYWGANVDQNTFCDLAFGYDTNSDCPDDQATLANDQQAFDALDITPGTYTRVISASTLNREIASGRPINTRIEWNSGGGHMMAIYGYDSRSGSLNYYNPWPSDSRYNTASYNWYRSNNQFSWTHSLYGIGA